MRKIRYRLWLPVVFGAVAAGLMLRDLYVMPLEPCGFYEANLTPFWLCQAPATFFQMVSLPAFLIESPVRPFLRLDWPKNYLLEFPALLLWFWLCGCYLDLSLPRFKSGKPARSLAWMFSAIVSTWLWEAYNFRPWWSWVMDVPRGLIYDGPAFVLFLLSICAIGATVWSFLFGKRADGSRWAIGRGERRWMLSGFIAYVAAATFVCWYSSYAAAQKQADIQRRQAVLQGKVIDEKGQPASGVRVVLLPFPAKEKQQWKDVAWDITNSAGEYTLQTMNFGPHILAVRGNAEPYVKVAYADRYYPGVKNEPDAERLDITESLHLGVKIIQIVSIPVVRVPVLERWEDGTPEPITRLYVANTDEGSEDSGYSIGEERWGHLSSSGVSLQSFFRSEL